MDKKFIIEIKNNNVYVNGKLHCFSIKMDKDNEKDDLNKKAILALTNEMGYEAVFLFEEMIDELN